MFVSLAVIFFCIMARLWWDKFTPRGFAYWMVAMLFAAFSVGSEHRITVPSSAPRRQIEGRLAWIKEHGYGRGSYYDFGVLLPDGNVIGLRGAVTPPFFARHEAMHVTYLDERVYATYPRAIAIRVLSGPRAGWQDTVSADWMGPWLETPFGIMGVLVFAVLAGLHQRPRSKDLSPAAESGERDPKSIQAGVGG